MNAKRAFLFVNGEVRDPYRIISAIQEGDLLVAVDGGLRHLSAMGLTPMVIIGDLDSITADQEAEVIRSGCQVLRFPPQKDETDLELALDYIQQQGCRQICIVGGLGGRLDQTLGNIYLLTQSGLGHCDVRIDDGLEEVWILRDSAKIQGEPGDIVSLLPVSEQVVGVRTENLLYPLRSETLNRDRTRGISNVMENNQAIIDIQSGLLLCIHSRKGSSSGH